MTKAELLERCGAKGEELDQAYTDLHGILSKSLVQMDWAEPLMRNLRIVGFIAEWLKSLAAIVEAKDEDK